jgi:hypothetical protein
MTAHDTAQARIDVQRDGMGILRHLTTYDYYFSDGAWKFSHGGVKWSVSVFMTQFLWSRARVIRAFNWLLSKSYAHGSFSEFWGTPLGAEAYHEAVLNKTFASNVKFKQEALTGLSDTGNRKDDRGDWQRSKLTWAALPRTCQRGVVGRDPAELMMASGRLSQLAEDNAVTMDELIDANKNGLLKQCSSCGRIRIHHKNKKRPDGIQSQCVYCRKARRKRR